MARVGTARTNPGPPYPGARPFQYPERDRFFGRFAEAADLAEMWRTNRLVIVYGRAGSGKTSLLSAGVLPLVTGGKTDVTPLGRFSYGATFPDAALPEHDPLTLGLLRSWSSGEDTTRLAGLSVRDYVSQRAERHGGRILAGIDQAEELLAGSGPRRVRWRRLLDELGVALTESPQLHLLLSIREDALQEFSGALPGAVQYRVASLRPQDALDAVTRPVEGTGRLFAAGAAEELVTDLLTSPVVAADGRVSLLAGDQVEPALLQAACAHLWESLPAEIEDITDVHIRQHSGADVALAAYCGRIVAAVADEHDLSPARLRLWLTRTLVTEHGTRGTAHQGPVGTAGMPSAVPRALEDRHLLATRWISGQRWYELLSDRLIEPLRNAVYPDQPGAQPASLLRYAEHVLTLGDLDLTHHYAGRALRAAPDNGWRLRAEANSLLGNLARERGYPAQAEAHYRVAADLFEAVRDTGAVASHLAAVGQMLLDQERPAEAARELRAAVDRTPRDLMVQTKLGWALWALGQGRAAVAVLTGVLEIDGGDPEALRARGEILADLGETTDALRDLGRLTGKERPSTRAARGMALAGLGRQGADELVGAALADAPGNGSVLFYAARARMLSGDSAGAADLAGRALAATDPALPPHQREATLGLAGQAPE